MMKGSILIYVMFLVGTISLCSSCKKQEIPTTSTTDSLKIGLTAYYSFNNTAADSSGNANSGVVFNITDTTNRYGTARSAYYFNGTTSYIRVSDNSALRLNATNFTVNAWVRLDSYNASIGSAIFCKRNATTASGWTMMITGAKDTTGNAGATYFGPGGSGLYATSSRVIPLLKWTMITYTYNASGKIMNVYINGVLDSFTPSIATPLATATGDLFIGRDYPASTSTGYFFKGALDDLRIYSRQLSAAQIQKLYVATN